MVHSTLRWRISASQPIILTLMQWVQAHHAIGAILPAIGCRLKFKCHFFVRLVETCIFLLVQVSNYSTCHLCYMYFLFTLFKLTIMMLCIVCNSSANFNSQIIEQLYPTCKLDLGVLLLIASKKITSISTCLCTKNCLFVCYWAHHDLI